MRDTVRVGAGDKPGAPTAASGRKGLKPRRVLPIAHGMESFLITLGYGLAALLGVATTVATWEHWRSQHRVKALPDPAPGPTRVDVDLADLSEKRAGNDQEQRQTTVDATMARMTQVAPGGTGAAPWIETRPMVALGPVLAPSAAAAPAEQTEQRAAAPSAQPGTTSAHPGVQSAA